MSKRAILLIAGIVTSMVLVLGVGVAASANRANQAAAATNTTGPTSTTSSGVCVNPADVAALQAQLNDYQTALQQANSQLQAAYTEIAALQNQGGSFGGGEQNEHEGGGFFPER